jgi:hypothetical protein
MNKSRCHKDQSFVQQLVKENMRNLNNMNPYMSQLTITRLQPRTPDTKNQSKATAAKSRNEIVSFKKS